MRAGAGVTGPATIPDLRGLPVLGSMLLFRSDLLGLLSRMAALGPVARFHLGPVPVHVLTDGALAQAALVDHADAFRKSRELSVFLRPLLGDGLLTSEGMLHRRQRKLLAPAFAHKRIASYAAVMADESAATARSWRDGAVIDVAATMMEMTLSIVGQALFSADVRGDSAVVASALTEAMEAMLASMTSLVQLPESWPLPRHLRMRRAVTALDTVVFRLIAEHRRAEEDRGDVLSALIAACDDEDGSTMTDRQIRDEVMTLVLAGHETTANALAWALYALSRHPAARERVEAEADSLGGRAPTVDDLPRLTYTAMVIEEAMRLWPPAFVLGRTAIRDVTLGGYRFPAGAAIFVNTWGMHRHPDLYEQPEEFRPERFTADAKKVRGKGTYLPFGAGPRICIGNHFALMEAQLALTAIAAAVRLDAISDKPVEAEPLMTLRPRGGLPMKVTRRR